jgi:two-component system, chemotaxis family, protein-glutamate methylesterase/glutaminase
VPNRDIIVVGGSAGSGISIRTLLNRLPANFPGSVFVVTHLDPTDRGIFAANLARDSMLRVEEPHNPTTIRAGTCYVARPDHHLVVRPNQVSATRGVRENLWRPALDVTFRSAAVAYGPRVIAVLLSGELDDGTAGLAAVKACGGITIVQDPQETTHRSMLETAIDNVAINHRVRVAQIPALLMTLVQQVAPPASSPPPQLVEEVKFADVSYRRGAIDERTDPPSIFSCPDCGGPLWESDDAGLRYRCLTGHAYHADTLLHAWDEKLEETLWAAVRVFEQRARLEQRLFREAAEHGRTERARIYSERVEESEAHVRALRDLLQAGISNVGLVEPQGASALAPQEPQDQRDHDADDDHRGNGKEEFESGPVHDDVAGQMPKRQFGQPRPRESD